MSNEPEQTTQILAELCDQRPDAADRLMPRVYDELRRIAAGAMRHERRDHTLQPTALVNEAYMRLIDQNQVKWEGRAHFCAVASNLMRRILIDHARSRNAEKRGGKSGRIPMHDELVAVSQNDEIDVLELDRLLVELSGLNERHAKVIELRFFGGLTIDETAIALDVSDWTVKSDWRVARAWLLARMSEDVG